MIPVTLCYKCNAIAEESRNLYFAAVSIQRVGQLRNWTSTASSDVNRYAAECHLVAYMLARDSAIPEIARIAVFYEKRPVTVGSIAKILPVEEQCKRKQDSYAILLARRFLGRVNTPVVSLVPGNTIAAHTAKR